MRRGQLTFANAIVIAGAVAGCQLLVPSDEKQCATDGDCGLYYVELQPAEENDPAVYADHHDRDCPIKIAESLGEFLSWRRVASNG